MTETQKVLCTLLDEIDELCQKNELDYFLGYETALHAYRSHKFENPTTYITILMPLKDMLKLRELIHNENRPDREIDSIYDNDFYPNLTFRYSDKNSLYLNLNESLNMGFKSHGLFIKICVLRRHHKSFKRSIMRFFEYGWVYSNPDYYTGMLRRKIIKKTAEILIKISRPLYKKILIDLFESTQKSIDYNQKLIFRSMYGHVTRFPENTFNEKQYVEFEGRKYPIPADAEKYFKAIYHRGWEEHQFKDKRVRENFIVDPRLPYNVFLDHINENNISLDFKESNLREKKARYAARMTNKPINKAWKYALRTGARFKMWEHYMPLKDEIIRLYKDENWDALREILSDYHDTIMEFNEQKMVVFFDREIFDIYKALLVYDGHPALAERLERRIPECHLNPIDIKIDE